MKTSPLSSFWHSPSPTAASRRHRTHRLALLFSLLLAGLTIGVATAQTRPPPLASAQARAALLPFQLDLSPGFPRGDEVLALWRRGDRKRALQLLEGLKAEGVAENRRQLMRGVLLLELKKPGEAAQVLQAITQPPPQLLDHLLSLTGQALLGDGRRDEAMKVLERLPQGSSLGTTAAVQLARAALKEDDPRAALEALEPLTEGKKPSELGPTTLLLSGQALEAVKTPASLTQAASLYRTLTVYHPYTAEATQAHNRLAELKKRGLTIPEESPEETLARGQAILAQNRNQPAIEVLLPLTRQTELPQELRCQVAFTLGTAYQNLHRYREASPQLQAARSLCDKNTAARALYRLLQGASRDADMTEAEALTQELAVNFAQRTIVDDAIFLLAATYQGRGDQDRARTLLEEQLRRYPQGDMRAEAGWRLAWTAYRQGRLDEAISRVEGSLSAGRQVAWEARARQTAPGAGGAGALTGTQLLVPEVPVLLREAYWRARWLQLSAPGRSNAAEDAYATLVEWAPMDYYGVLALERLRQLNPARAQGLEQAARQPRAVSPRPVVEEALPVRVKRAVELMRCGMDARAVTELRGQASEAAEQGDLLPSWLLEKAGHLELSHNIIRRIFSRGGDLHVDADSWPLYALGWPLAYEDEVSAAAAEAGIDPLLLLAIAREESAFDAEVRSWAGALGLVQLMEFTGKAMAAQVGEKHVTADKLLEPSLNLRLGARYLANLSRWFGGHTGVMVPGYNAGEGNISKWLKQRGNLPYDEWVEEIPYKQTREYARRVVSTWQTYHYLYAPDAPFVRLPLELPKADLSR